MQRPDSDALAPPHAGRLSSPFAALTLVLLLFAAAGMLRHTAEPPPGPAPTQHDRIVSATADPAATTTVAEASGEDRIAATPEPDSIAPGAASTALDFETAVERLCALATTTATLAQQDELEAARRSDGETRQLFARVLEQFADTGERSLQLLTSLLAPFATALAAPDGVAGDTTDDNVLDEAHHIVLQMLLAADLQRRSDQAAAARTFDRLDALTQTALDLAPVHPTLAEIVDACLNSKDYLRLTHEPAVLQLVAMAGERQFSREIATRLLRTLWDNLQRSGERSSDELLRLAVVLLETHDASQALVACRHLLAEPRFRALVLARLRERGDRTLCAELAQLASTELEPKDALDVLRELHPLIDNARGSYLGLGLRAPEAVADAYRSHLADDTCPAVRRDLVMGLGMLPDRDGLELASLALANDPSPDVRLQAAFVFTVRGTPAQAERALEQLLDDPEIANDPARLSGVVIATQNLEQADVNVVARLASRLAIMPLPASGRQLLEEIVARCLPGGTLPGAALPLGTLPGPGR